ncbi:MAG TPA: YoaK family protein [Pyrinomonadaceae bacterium]|nr:YoaK family protein [Pyrinomonadaceae bacterium]
MSTLARQAEGDSRVEEKDGARAGRESPLEREKAWVAVLLACVAGAVDAVGYLTLFHLFTAHMSGNSVAMGAHLGRREWGEAFRRMFPIPVFVLGVTLGGVVTEVAGRRGVRAVFSPALALEMALLFAFMILGSEDFGGGGVSAEPSWKFYALAGLPALAMGVQSATLRRVGGQTVRTTYITGLLTNLTEECVAFLFWLRDRTRRAGEGRGGWTLRVLPKPSARRLALLGGVYGGYVFGAVAGSCAELRWSLLALILPLCGLAVVVGCDLVRPIYEPAD